MYTLTVLVTSDVASLYSKYT